MCCSSGIQCSIRPMCTLLVVPLLDDSLIPFSHSHALFFSFFLFLSLVRTEAYFYFLVLPLVPLLFGNMPSDAVDHILHALAMPRSHVRRYAWSCKNTTTLHGSTGLRAYQAENNRQRQRASRVASQLCKQSLCCLAFRYLSLCMRVPEWRIYLPRLGAAQPVVRRPVPWNNSLAMASSGLRPFLSGLGRAAPVHGRFSTGSLA